MLVPSSTFPALLLVAALPSLALAQESCPGGTARVTGTVLDGTGAAVAGALVTLAPGKAVTRADRSGRFATACVALGEYTVVVEASSFATSADAVTAAANAPAVLVRLQPETVKTEVTAAVEGTGADSTDIGGAKTLTGSDVAQLADDPDEFSRQLQVLAAAAGGAPGQAIVTVDGFQNSGQIPPKSAIALIRINPDLFSAEYARPPYQGGRVEIYTKPGQGSFHGALFTTQSGQYANAKDPFSPSRAALGKQRYGFELSGPVVRNHSDFAVALEHRQISEFAVVDAVTLDAEGNPMRVTANVAAPQSLWEASAQMDVMLTPKNNLSVAYTGNVDGLDNQGVGGTTLQEAGYNTVQSEHVLHLSDLETLSPTLVHETRIGYTWRYRRDAPESLAPSLQVAGAFTSGGVSTGLLRSHERDLEVDDDVLYTHGKHNVKAGLELLDTSLHDSSPANFNGTYLFGGGVLPGSTATLTGLQQYQLAVRSEAGGTPTQFNVTTGTPTVSLNQLQVVLYAQDQWKVRPRLQLALGLRWAMQNAPVTVGNAGPRFGLAWSPDRRQKTVFHARTGLFFGTIDPQTTLAALQLNGTTQRQLQINNAVYVPYGSSSASALPLGTSVVTTLRAPLPKLSQQPSLESHLGVEHEFPRHWHVQTNLFLVHGWDILRSRNINAPLDGTPSGVRPSTPDLNVEQFQQSAHLGGNVLFAGVDQHSLKRLQIFAGYIRMDLRGTSDGATSFPQNSFSDAGEDTRLAWEATHQIIAFANYQLPWKASLSMQFNTASGLPYNVLTGFDNNGDGVFNDRPAFANGTESMVYHTRFGALTPAGTGLSLSRNAGTLPWNVHLDANLSRSFALPHKAGKEARTVAVNVRSTNLLNHTNVLAVGNVLGSPLFGEPYQADPGRRVEAGLRWSF